MPWTQTVNNGGNTVGAKHSTLKFHYFSYHCDIIELFVIYLNNYITLYLRIADHSFPASSFLVYILLLHPRFFLSLSTSSFTFLHPPPSFVNTLIYFPVFIKLVYLIFSLPTSVLCSMPVSFLILPLLPRLVLSLFLPSFSLFTSFFPSLPHFPPCFFLSITFPSAAYNCFPY